MLNEQHELMRLVIQAIKTDLSSRNELHVCLALHCISNIGGKETAVAVSTEVQRLLVAKYCSIQHAVFETMYCIDCVHSESPKPVQKKAALAMLRLFREAPDQLVISEYASRIVQQLSSSDKVSL